MVDKREVRDRAEAAVADALTGEGFAVINLNELVDNTPFMDLLASRTGRRLLVQVKGTTTTTGKFGAPPAKARALVKFATALDCDALYAFVQLGADETLIRWATAEHVAAIAEQAVEEYHGILRYHILIDEIEAASVSDLFSTID